MLTERCNRALRLPFVTRHHVTIAAAVACCVPQSPGGVELRLFRPLCPRGASEGAEIDRATLYHLVPYSQ